ncbi:Hsp20/alpha crystallin family protein [Cupriavidus taiwanensis]|uniref:Small heat shock protein (HSP20) family protein n=2 Tax=Cupriavidus taiwanensis TaxID=164546 RepID=B3RCY5_CUPTR|nr:Hsp20/alpha crystallin family protein [Cupriavidus taiwanensis]CAQ72760.1 Putative small heat shock protein (HSP20) family protein [Cupriavidus taiwanensis LMG 19424]SOZ09011.1 Putative small heat shock protein (HSP20) family protein [Cupriavidus taiwanensis]SOZ11257.1 Putative small heat shock protein (HSP20) family protein [Cupriavidus taiwanensis]SOZ42609.1 Putative small heat shock protein (HSP20) family protein [Cupriavidus taiwanensis]SPC20167.1 putative small heat shock protein (HSP2
MSDLFFGTDLFNELDRMQRQMASLVGGFPSSIRSGRFGAFPPVNIGATDDSFEVVAFVPGIRQDKLEVSIDKGLLTISGEREPTHAVDDPELRLYKQERFTGSFRRVVELPQSADPGNVQARYANGCLSVTVGKQEASKPRAITVQ